MPALTGAFDQVRLDGTVKVGGVAPVGQRSDTVPVVHRRAIILNKLIGSRFMMVRRSDLFTRRQLWTAQLRLSPGEKQDHINGNIRSSATMSPRVRAG